MIENFSEKLKKYAELIVKVGVNVQKGQPVVLYISVTQQELAHLIVEEAYEAGASEVMIEWKDTFSEREFLKHASEERLENVPEYIVKKGNYIAEKKAARISVMSADPGAYAGIEQKRIAKNQAAISIIIIINAAINLTPSPSLLNHIYNIYIKHIFRI